jgi:hypothetical protein
MNPAPGGGSFNAIPLYVTSRPTTVSASQTVADGGTLSLGAVEVTATGSGTVSLAQFASDPARTAPPHPADAFLGLFATPGNTYTDLSLVDCTPSSGQVLDWLDGAVWRPVSNQRFSNGCISVDLSATSSPSIQQLTGIYLGSQSTPKSDCGAAQGGTLDLHAANLDGCSLPGASLAGVDLRRATLLGTFLLQSNLAGANLAHTTFEHADLVGATLSRANLQGANLTDADLSRANLAGADLSGARLEQVTWSGTTCPDGTSSDADGGTCAAHLAP